MANGLIVSSGVIITEVRISNFRSLKDVEVKLDPLTVLMGSNNSGKTSFLDALYAAIGAGRRGLSQEDIRVAPQEAIPPRDRTVLIDIRVRPTAENGETVNRFPAGSFWTSLWGQGITPAVTSDSFEYMAFRTIFSWNPSKGEYVVERKFLKEWRPYEPSWLTTPVHDRDVTSSHIEPIALNYIDAKRDLEDDLRKQGSFWRKLTDDLGLPATDVAALETQLTNINDQIVEKSEILRHIKDNLASIQSLVSAEGAGIDISPVARQLRDISKGIDVSFSTAEAQSFPLIRHGMGTRSLASLLVFRAFASWRSKQAHLAGNEIHSMLALEEPESHLHPQAQRSLFCIITSIGGQRLVSTHSPYFAAQAPLSALRLFAKRNGETIATQLDATVIGSAEDMRKVQDRVIQTRGDLLFGRGVVLFEGQTEEQALPIWAERYWGASIHELGFSFVRVNGTDYLPFVSLAKQLGIPWYILADGESLPKARLNSALKKLSLPEADQIANIVVISNGNNFETQFIAEGYLPEIETTLNRVFCNHDYLGKYIDDHDGKKGKGNVVRNYKAAGGRKTAAIDVLSNCKTAIARPLAETISHLPDKNRRFPVHIKKLFEVISTNHGLTQFGETA